MDGVVVILLVLLIFMMSCDAGTLHSMRDKVLGVCSSREQKNIEKFLGTRDQNVNWSSSSPVNGMIGDVEQFNDISLTLDKSIVDSHMDYTKETDYLASVGASHATDTTHSLRPVTFHGLPRTAHFKHTASESTSRVSQSETIEDIEDIRETVGLER